MIKRNRFGWVMVLFLLLGVAQGVELAEAVPEIAVARLREVLRGELSADERGKAIARLGEVLVQAKQPADALALLEKESAPEPARSFWRAQALADLGRAAEALPAYRQVAQTNSPLALAGKFGEAEMLRVLGKSNEALIVLQSLFAEKEWAVRAHFRAAELLLEANDPAGAARLVDEARAETMPDRKERRYLRARVEAWRNRDKAIEMFESILRRPEETRYPVLIAALLGFVDTHLQARTPEPADERLAEFIERNPSDPELPRLFAKLDEVYRAERKPSRNDLGRWAHHPAQPRRALALWYYAKSELRLGHREGAVSALIEIRQSEARSPALTEPLLELARLQMEEQKFDETLVTLETARAHHPSAEVTERIAFLEGQTNYQAKRFAVAGEIFQKLAGLESALATDAHYNAALCWLQAGENERFTEQSGALGQSASPQIVQADLLLEQALLQASRHEKAAASSLQKFLQQFPNGRRAAEAWVALAELAYHASPPDLQEARADLARAFAAQPDVATRERADYLSIWIEEAAPGADGGKLIRLASEFVRNHAGSAVVPNVRLKLAEIYFQRQDFSDAQTQFELLARADPAGPLGEKALFFAAQAARSTMSEQSLDHALALLDEVAKKGGEMKWAARNEQAGIERKLGKHAEALVLYDDVLKGDAKPPERREALCGRGDVYFEMGATDPENYRRAIASYEQLASERKAGPDWRNQALFKKGVCLEKLNDRPGALATFGGLLEQEMQPNPEHELFWFYKAGFSVGRLLEEDAKWESAVAIYRKLASAAGPRSEEAKARLAQLRLEHFLWDE